MKKVTLAIAMAALVIFAGCKKDKETTRTTLTASIEQCNGGDSKTSIVPVGSEAEIRWTAGDKIVVNNGSTNGIFTLVGAGGSTSGTFNYNGEYTFGDNNIAVYPETATISGNTVTVTLPAEQDFDANKNGANPMLGIFTDPEELTFTSLCGVLGISLTGDNIAITAVEVVSKTDEKLNGEFSCTTTNPQLTVAAGDADTKKVRINYNTTLTSTAQNFYFALPVGALASGFTLNVYGVGADPIFSKATTNAITIALNVVNQMPVVEVTAGPLSNIVDISTLTADFTAQDGDILTGTLGGFYRISIADGATVTLNGVTINQTGSWGVPNHPGINCQGDVTIILADGTTNTVRPMRDRNPAIYIANGKTLTIKGGELGTGSLTAGSTNQYSAGIGSCSSSGFSGSCGNIVIEGGIITAQGGYYCAGIGAANTNGCGNITITGGTVTATGGKRASGIGAGSGSSCGTITIANTVTQVTATKGSDAINSIGRGYNSSTSHCGTVTIGGTVYWNGSAYQNGGDTYLPTSPLVYPSPETTITWTSTFINSVSIMPWGHDSGVSASDGGITATFTENAGLCWSGTLTIGNSSTYGITFSTASGNNISKIEIYGVNNSAAGLPSGWDYDDETHKVTWQGTPASSVTMNGVNADPGEDVQISSISQIVFTVQ